MIGAIIGDIVGSRFERANHKSTDFELFTKECHFTDDTVMTLAVAKALLDSQNNWGMAPRSSLYRTHFVRSKASQGTRDG